MNGLELSKKYYEECGKPVLENEFPELLKYIAVGFVGSGSDKFGFDDEISRDHDFEPGFCIFLPSEEIIDRRNAFLLERAYAKLPKEFEGFKRQNISPVGGNRNGVIRTSDFYLKNTGCPDGKLSTEQWLHIPDYALAEATNGEVFFDDYGEFSNIRNCLLNMPNDVRLKRIAGNLLLMVQSGQYNFIRCLKHGEPQAAQLAANEFVTSALKVIFLLNNRYMPYYKWSFRALEQIPNTIELKENLSYILFGDNCDDYFAQQKYNTIEDVCTSVISLLQDKEITDAVCGDLEKHAYSVNDRIENPTIRNYNIFEAV